MYPNFSNLEINDVDRFKQASTSSLNKNSPNQFVNKNSYGIQSDSSAFQLEGGYEVNNLENNYGDIRLDLEPDNYPKKYKKFVNELITLLNCIMISNVSKII